MGSKNIERLCEDVVVDKARVDGEEGHGEDDVATAEENAKDLALGSNLFKSGNEKVGDIIANITQNNNARRWQWLWCSWQSGRFRYQRTQVQIQSSSTFIEHLLTVNCL